MDFEDAKMGQWVRIKMSGEVGRIEGLAEYLHTTPSVYVHYKAADGRAVSDWISPAHLEHCEEPSEESATDFADFADDADVTVESSEAGTIVNGNVVFNIDEYHAG